MGVGGISIWQLIIIIFILLIPILVFGPVVKKAGFTRWWVLLMAIPLVNIIAVWVFAFVAWPAERDA